MKRVGCLAVGLLILGTIVLFAPNLLEIHARWLMVEDTARPADAVLVLGGGRGERVRHAIRLYHAGLAPALYVTGTAEPVIPRSVDPLSLTPAEADRVLAIHQGVPEEDVTVILGPSSTYEEADVSLEIFRSMGFKRVILVTSPYHSRRARQTFRRLYRPAGIEVVMLPAPWADTAYDPRGWWRRERDAMAVFVESAKLSYYLFRYGVFPI
jgi:uncharacterized SAM-binding protein YcdF (DUF218 family)